MLAECPANAYMFDHADWGHISVATFYERQYGITLKYPELPPVGFGGTKRPKMVPMELCEFVGGEPHASRRRRRPCQDCGADVRSAEAAHVRRHTRRIGLSPGPARRARGSWSSHTHPRPRSLRKNISDLKNQVASTRRANRLA